MPGDRGAICTCVARWGQIQQQPGTQRQRDDSQGMAHPAPAAPCKEIQASGSHWEQRQQRGEGVHLESTGVRVVGGVKDEWEEMMRLMCQEQEGCSWERGREGVSSPAPPAGREVCGAHPQRETLVGRPGYKRSLEEYVRAGNHH